MYEKRYCYLKYYVCRHASFSGVVILPRCLLPRDRLDPPLDLTLFIGRASSKWTQTRYRQLMNWVLFGEDLSEAPELDCGCFAYINWILVWVKLYAVNTADNIWLQKHQVLSIITVIGPHLRPRRSPRTHILLPSHARKLPSRHQAGHQHIHENVTRVS